MAINTAGPTIPNNMTTIQNNKDLLRFLIDQSGSGKKDWFGFSEQKITGIDLCYELAQRHAPAMTPEQVVDYVVRLNNTIFQKIIMGKTHG